MSFNLREGEKKKKPHKHAFIDLWIRVFLENVNHNHTKLEISAYPETSDEFANSFSLLAFRTLQAKCTPYIVVTCLSPEIKKVFSFLGRIKINERYIMRFGFAINRTLGGGGDHQLFSQDS